MFENTIQVESAKLDDWCLEHGISKIDFLWADVQGAEGDLIEGARETLRKTKYIKLNTAAKSCMTDNGV